MQQRGGGGALLCLRIISMHSTMGHGLKLVWSEIEKYERQISATIHIKVLLNSFRCNGHTLGFHSQTSKFLKVRTTLYSIINSVK